MDNVPKGHAITDITSLGPLCQNEALFGRSSSVDWIPKIQIPGIHLQ